ncbi:MAG: hypothetical protein HC778_07150 [Chamaesiphon sp. CSU_1_12]|nr:hypothetical protein [Chamaesiphon sp. CSU_1_12]
MSYSAVTSPDLPLQLQIVYLSERDLDRDGQVLLVESIRTQLNAPTAQVNLERIAPIWATLTFPLDRSPTLDPIVQTLLKYPTLGLEIVINRSPSEVDTDVAARSEAISTYLQTQGIVANRLSITTTTATPPTARLQIVVKSA